MAAEYWLNDGGSWREMNEIHVNDSGVWRDCIEKWVNDSGTWRLVFQRTSSFVVTLPADFTVTAVKVLPVLATASLILEIDGDVMSQINVGATIDKGDVLDDITGFDGSLWEARVTLGVGETLDAGTVNTWQTLDVERIYSVEAVDENRTSVLTVEVREVANTSNTDTMVVTLNADSNPF